MNKNYILGLTMAALVGCASSAKQKPVSVGYPAQESSVEAIEYKIDNAEFGPGPGLDWISYCMTDEEIKRLPSDTLRYNGFVTSAAARTRVAETFVGAYAPEYPMATGYIDQAIAQAAQAKLLASVAPDSEGTALTLEKIAQSLTDIKNTVQSASPPLPCDEKESVQLRLERVVYGLNQLRIGGQK